VHHFAATFAQKDGVDVATETRIVHIANAAGTLAAVKAVVNQAAAGGDKNFTIDVKKSSGGGAYASMLSAAITMNSGNTARVAVAGTPGATPTYVAGDVLEIVITTGGSTGNQAQGLAVTLLLQENPA
jgi:hypothetical protein